MNRSHEFPPHGFARPVPFAQYLRYLGNRVALLSSGGLMSLLGLTGLLLVGLFVIAPTRCDLLLPPVSSWSLLLLLLFPFSLCLMGIGERNIEIARQMEALTPCTRHNIGLLPAEQCLVRASMQNPNRSADALLRPIAATPTEPPSQLLRIGEPPA